MPLRLTTAQAAAAGLIAAPLTAQTPPLTGSHAAIVATYSDALLDSIIDDLGTRNLRDFRDHETRWLGERMKACRAERRARKGGKP